jgi:hypothetical protein
MTRSPFGRRALGALALAAVAMSTLSACTIIRYRDPPEPEPDPEPPAPKVVDVLVMVELERSTSSLADAYAGAVTQLLGGLALQNVTVRKLGVAPMYSRIGDTVPLIYGEGDPNGEFGTIAEAIGFYAMDDGERYLRDRVEADGENLAAIGLELDTRPVYNPTTANADAAPYFGAPADGFVVVQLTAKERTCGVDDAACALDGGDPANYFTTEVDGAVDWLELPGGNTLGKKQVYHLAIATQEGVDFDTFASSCEGRPDFPANKLDFMEPSSRDYYTGLTGRINDRGGKADFVDMCLAMSPVSAAPEMVSVAQDIRSDL